jgi:hypothetical protein
MMGILTIKFFEIEEIMQAHRNEKYQDIPETITTY